MDESLILMVVCGLPTLAVLTVVVLIVWAVRASSSSRRLADVEVTVRHLRTANDALVARVADLERAAASGEAPLAAPEPARAESPEAAPSDAPSSAVLIASTLARRVAPLDSVAAATPAAPEPEPLPPAPTPESPPPAQPPERPDPGDGSPASPGDADRSWERWIGVRGAAALGAGVLVLAGLFFFKYSIEHGLITETMRVVFGTLTGLACIVGSEWPLRRRYPILADWLAGAGSAILYLAVWAAAALYHLIGVGLAFPLMAAVTATCCVLSVKRRALAIALLGLLGGFATPILLSTGTDRPIALFGYLLLLDAALLFVAHRRRWPFLALLAIAGTTLYQGMWIVGRMGDRLWLGLAILAVFAVLFAIVPARDEDGAARSKQWPAVRVIGVLLPFVFALYFALQADLGPHLYPVALFLGGLSIGATWVGRRESAPVLGLAAAAATVAVVAAWLVAHHALEPALAWEVVACVAALALVFHAPLEIGRPERSVEAVLAAAVASLGFFVLTVFAAGVAAEVAPWPWILGWVALAALALRHGSLARVHALTPTAAVLFGFGLVVLHLARGGDASFPSEATFLAVSAAIAAAFHIFAVTRHVPVARALADDGAAAIALVLLLHHLALPAPTTIGPALFYVGTDLLALLMLLAATRRGSGVWSFVTVAATALVHGVWTAMEPELGGAVGWTALGGQLAALAVFTAWPFFASPRLREDAWAWRAAAMAAPFGFLSLRALHLALFGSGAIGLLPVGLAVVTILAARGARTGGPREQQVHRTALVWLTAVAMGFVTVAIPLQLEKQWITIGWALEGLAALLLWKRFDHAGLKYFGLALLATASVRLVLNPYLLDYYPRVGLPALNWLAYTYVVPAACLVGAWWILRLDERARLRPWERQVLPASHDIAAGAAVVASIAVLFVWINLSIFDIFASSDRLEIPTTRMPARDLTTSIAWAGYGLVLLALGMWRGSTALRALSLGLVLLTCGKVFLYDLAHLRDLYRVASLVGLALSLILISFAYQRFVFRRPASAEGT